MTRSIFSLLRFLENQNGNYMENQQVWKQQKGERESDYNLFVQFLNFEGNIKNFAEEQEKKSENGVKASAIQKTAQRLKWLARRDAYQKNKQETNSSGIFQSIKQFEVVLVKIFGYTLNEINNRIENGTFELPKGKELDFLKFAMTAMDKLPGIIRAGYRHNSESSVNNLDAEEFVIDGSLLDEDE